ncbi:urate hydroxylase PuuD [Prosthecomicrobium sp. N25]|uniref:urate hydroxylase PuuD n=1 Tax=Prosthecomicrobium sp. N25 TaxID=3129254 RepID=UPI003077E542
MEAFAADWLNLLIRWFHLVVGIGWIGASFYFIGLDVSLRKRAQMNEGVYGTAWEVHGGGFYHVEKYLVAPKQLPEDLIWYKWEAYLTFLSGFALLVVQYYWNAKAYLIDPKVLALAPWQAILISIAGLAAGWAGYDALCRSRLGQNTTVLAVLVFLMIVAAAVLFAKVFSGRGALIHVGAFVGTIMAANVFMIIIPNQRKIVASLLKGEAPDPRLGAIGKQRSVHNTYLTLPVLLMMVSNHYPMLTNHPQSWLLVALVLVIGGTVRHFFVRHEAGDPIAKVAWAPGVAAVGIAAALVLTAPRTDPALAGIRASDADVLRVTATHCTACHAAKPRHEGFAEPPKGVTLEHIDDIRRYAQLIDQQAVKSDAMPLGNETGITDDERRLLGAWIARQ